MNPRLIWAALVLVALAALVSLGWLLGAARPAGPHASDAVAAAGWTLADGSLAAVADPPGDEAVAAALGPTAAPQPDAALGPDCGFAPWLERPGTLPTDAEKARIHRQVAAGWLASLQASPDMALQAVGRWLGSTTFNVHEPALADCRGEGCRPVLQRLVRRVERLSGQRAQAAQSLQTQALASSDPRVLALAAASCHFQAPTELGDCLAGPAARWVALEPDNAAAWLQQAQAAHLQGDWSGEADAIHHASLATRYQPPGTWVGALLDRQLPADLQGEPRVVLQIAVAGAVATLSNVSPSVVDHCRQTAVEDPNRAQTCLRLAELLLAQAPDLITLAYAEALGRHAGWSEERQNAQRAQREALMAAQQREAQADLGQDGGDSGPSCRQLLRGGAMLQRVARLGELRAMRELAQR
ncbi:hypothetical protein KAK07_02455 [Ideonella sp. 4Y16]|uniref:hypothetical protein n=1 Tax=Ideonella alba TaxID=2824118 RepID=UPI001B3971E6|nr:hypothetical protein [Ideonella alba]MBQ0942192.1 hypothetical protein [Ideonella alba]